jgi:hypothetical protein
VLLGAGVLSAALAGIGPQWTLGALASIGVAGGILSLSMDEIQS